MVEVVFYTRPDCGLCDEARALLSDLAARYPYRLTEVNILTDDALFRRYWDTIPVIRIADQALLQAPIDPDRLEAALSRAARQSREGR